jgi:hypothetical protein
MLLEQAESLIPPLEQTPVSQIQKLLGHSFRPNASKHKQLDPGH